MSATAENTVVVHAYAWSITGALIAYATCYLIPELVRQRRREETENLRYRVTGLQVVISVVVLFVVVAGGVVAVEILDPCKPGDAAIAGLGTISFLSGLLGLNRIGLSGGRS